MKAVLNDYLRIIMYTIFGILFAMSSYIIVLNISHQRSLSNYVMVSEIDNDYVKYKDNVNLIEEKIKDYQTLDNNLYLSLSKVTNSMKKDGVFRLIPKEKITYRKLYELNDYFMEELINNNWVHSIKNVEYSKKYQEIVNMLSKNSIYLNSILTNNSLILYDNDLDNKIEDNYHFLLRNYAMYSNVILSICNELGGING